METTPFYLNYLKNDLTRRQRVNPSYSLRAYARFLQIHPQTLSAILNQKRALPSKRADFIATRLDLSPRLRIEFLESVYHHKASVRALKPVLTHSPNSVHTLLEKEDQFEVIAEWEHYAIFELIGTRSFKPEPRWIAKRLGISDLRARVAFERLLKLGLVKIDASGKISRSVDVLRTTEDVASVALKKSHSQALEMGAAKLEEIPVDLRDFSSITLPVNLKRIQDAKALIRDFRRQLSALLERGEKTEVYQLCVQLYPLTQLPTLDRPKTKEGKK